MLVNDSIYLLDESLKKLEEIRAFETRQREPEWEQLSREEQGEQESNHRQSGKKGCYHWYHTHFSILKLARVFPGSSVAV